MQIFLRILKETGIAIVALALVTLIVWLLFNEQLPFLGRTIPNPIDYAEINREDFDITGDIEDETNPTQTYEPTNEQLNGYITDRYISTGAPNPFTSNNAEPDVPSERVTIENSANSGTSEIGGAGTESETSDAETTGSETKSLE